jgi:putative membrane protein
MKTILLTFLLIFPILFSKSFAQPISSTGLDKLKEDSAALNFVKNATLADIKEIETGRLAQLRGKDKDVIAYGKRMTREHTEASNELTNILKAKNMSYPKPSLPNDEHSNKLRNSTGGEFDKQYISMMVMDHQKTIDLFETASKNIQEPELKAFATKLLPSLKTHLNLAKELAAKLNVSTSAPPNGGQ